jgi:twitching motility protein PilT
MAAHQPSKKRGNLTRCVEIHVAQGYVPDAKVYPSQSHGRLSILDMLRRFEEEGTMRISDLHLKIGLPPLYRVDGKLVRLKGPPLTLELVEQLTYPLITDKNLAKFQDIYSIDSSYQVGSVQVRINIFRERDGISAAIRALSLKIPPLEQIGFPNNIWNDIINLTHGLVLVTGVAGSGKSTTIASLVERINEQFPYRIIMLEDPTEYVHQQKLSAISQRELGRDVGTFADGLKAVLREDPNVVVVGEMRDPETITMTLMAAETGHLVLSTLHTRDAAGTLTRILDYFPEGRQSEIVKSQLSLGLKYIICQKLIPRKNGDGRTVAMEILNNDYACANLIRTGKLEQIYTQMQTKTQNRADQKMITLEKHLAVLVREGSVDIAEASRWANNVKAFDDEMKYKTMNGSLA